MYSIMLKLYCSGEVAKRLNKSKEMIHKYIKQGKLVPFAFCSNGKQPLFDEKELLRFEQHRILTVKSN
jgi:DNA-binding transcriptional MerR regulator